MQPICLLLPVGSDLATCLWAVLELGFEARAAGDSRNLPRTAPPSKPPNPATRMASPHHRILATIFREHLLGISPRHAGIWMERRELADLLRLLECGLSRLDSRYSHPESLPLHLESVAEFLASVRAQMGALRKPAQRQPAPRARAASATAGAASNWAT